MALQMCGCDHDSHHYRSPARFASALDHGRRASFDSGETAIEHEGLASPMMVCRYCVDAGHA